MAKSVEFLFEGVDTVNDPATTGAVSAAYGATTLKVGTAIQNMDVSTLGARTRKGQSLIIPGVAHSGWSSGSYSYYVSSGVLYSFDGAASSAVCSVSDTPASYVNIENLTVFTNSVDYIALSGTNVIPVDTLTFDIPEAVDIPTTTTIPAGEYITAYAGRIYVARGGSVVYTLPANLITCDIDNFCIPVFNSEITGMAAVDNGIYVSSRSEVVFLSGNDPVSGGFELKQVSAYGAVPRTMVQADGYKIGKSGVAAIWATHKGFCVGDGSGNVDNVTHEYVAMPESVSGASMVREADGHTHIVTSLTQGSLFNAYVPPIIDTIEISA